MYKRIKSGIVNKVITVSVLLLLFVFLIPVELFAQGPSDDPSPCDFNGGVTSGSTTCPLDTWVWLLVAAAVVFGVINIHMRNKKQLGKT